MKPGTILLCTALALSLAGCNTDPLGEPCHCASRPQRVEFDWSADTGASPGGMRLWFYPLDWQGEAIPVDLPGRDGGNLSLPEGHYHIAAYNNDTEWLIPSGTWDFFAHALSTPDAGPYSPLGISAARAAGSQRVAACPEPLWMTSARNIYIGAGDTLRMSPTPMHCIYTYTFEGLDSLEHVTSASASISGMSAAVMPSTLTHRGDACTHPLQSKVDAVHGTVSGSFYTFGVPQDTAIHQRIALYVVLDDGRRYKFTQGNALDVTGQIRGASDRHRVNLVIRGLHIPGPDGKQGDGSGFDPSADDWQDEHVDVPV